MDKEKNLCPLCDRELDDLANEHHLIPKSLKGKDTITLHKICHNKIHHTFSERELANYYHTIERLKDHKEIQKFVKWIKKKPFDFYDGNKDTKDRKKKRKR